MADQIESDWERLLAAERHLQALVPESVLVGGTAAALHARHRISVDGDHVLIDLAAPWNDWTHLAARGRHWARILADLLLRGRLEETA